MSGSYVESRDALPVSSGQLAPSEPAPGRLAPATQYGLAMVFVAVAAALGFVVEHLIAAPNVTLVFVLPVVVAATAFGWWPALAAAVAGVLTFDFFFTEPYYSFRIASPADLWAAGLLLAIAAIVSSVAAESRARALEARRAAERAEALQVLAHAVIEARPPREVFQAAATALSRIFGGPAVVFADEAGGFLPEATAGGAEVDEIMTDAARSALANRIHTRGETYPFDRCAYDFWPLSTSGGRSFVLGVKFPSGGRGRPAEAERFIDVVGGYLAAAAQDPAAG